MIRSLTRNRVSFSRGVDRPHAGRITAPPTTISSSPRHGSNHKIIFQTRTFVSHRPLFDKKPETVAVVVPSRLGVGEEAPRFPHTLALPLVSRPLFPGLITSVTLTDPTTIQALDELSSNSSNTPAYISCFLRKKNSSGVTDGGVILETPEVITSPDDLYTVGSFAQIQRLAKGYGAKLEEDDSDASDSEDAASASATLILLAHRRVDLESVDNAGPPIHVTVRHWNRTDYTGMNDGIRALSNEIISTIREVASMNKLFRDNLQFFPMRVDAVSVFNPRPHVVHSRSSLILV